MMRFFLSVVLLVAVCISPNPARAASWYGAPFSADVVMINPENPKDQAKGKLHVGLDRFRSEGVYQGTKKVLIINMGDRKSYTLIPDRKAFHEGMSEALMPPKPDVERMPGDPLGPCKTDRQLTCAQEGNETVHGIPTEKWTIKASSKDASFLVTLWIDTKRRIVIKQQPENGPLMERKLLGVEKVNGRDTEKWEFIHSYQEQRNTFVQWVDVNLRIPVRMGEGRQASMEVANIVEGNQDEALFQVPADFKEIEPPPLPSPVPDQEGRNQSPRPSRGAEPKKGTSFQ
ncbi:MAG: hypothetical protein HQM02_12515, partial [Magnetococcales bacterium]|nr:hypothetical protein [Magnetococcales bacterium]